MTPSPTEIDSPFKAWLEGVAHAWGVSPEIAADRLDEDYADFADRQNYYPQIGQLFQKPTWTLAELRAITGQCPVLNEQHFAIRLSQTFAWHAEHTWHAIADLVQGFPSERQAAVRRIEIFMGDMKFTDAAGAMDRSGVALLGSALLSACYPGRFVDYRANRWHDFAGLLLYPMPARNARYGEKIVWAGELAQCIAATPTFRRYFTRGALGAIEPLWVVAGLAWHGITPEKPRSLR